MATETLASDHTSATHEQIVKKERSEVIEEMMASLANEDEVKHEKPADADGGHATNSSSKTEGDEEKAEVGVVEVEKSDDSPALQASAEDNMKHDKVDDAQAPAAPSTVVVVEKTNDPVSLEEKQPKTVDIPEASAETVEKSTNAAEANPQTKSEAEEVKEPEILETSAQKEEKPEPEPETVVTEVQEKTQEPEKESQEKPQEAVQPSLVTIPEANEKPSDAIEEKTREPSADILEETTENEAGPTETEKAEAVVTEAEENPKEPEKESLEQKEEEKTNTVEIPQAPSAESSEAIEEKTREPQVLKETDNYEAGPAEAEKAEPVVTKVDESPSEPEKQSFKQEEELLPKTVIPETEVESAKETGDRVLVHPPIESEKETDNSKPEAVPEKEEKPGDVAVVHPPIYSDVEVVKETGTSELKAVPGKEEKPEPVGEKPRELLEVAEDIEETSKDVEAKQEILLETIKIEGPSDDTIKDPISLKEEKTNKEEETSITAHTAQVSLNEEAQAAPENVVEPSTKVAEKVVEEDAKKESKDEAGVLKNPEQASIDQEAKTEHKEERDSVPASVEEKVAVPVNDNKKEPEAPESVQVLSREAEVEIKKDEANTATTEAGVLKAESVKDDGPAVDNEKGGQADTKVDEISSAVSEPVRETLASKFEEEGATETRVDNLEKEQTEKPVKTEVQAPEQPTKESDAIKTSSKDLPKETPTKPAHKQSNNIISRVKQSLVKAKKAITGKSPSSKTPSSVAKDDIKVK